MGTRQQEATRARRRRGRSGRRPTVIKSSESTNVYAVIALCLLAIAAGILVALAIGA